MATRGRAFGKLLPLALSLLAMVAAAGCGEPYPGNVFHPASDFAEVLAGLFNQIIFWAVIVFVPVEALLLYAIARYRRRGRPRPAAQPGEAHPRAGGSEDLSVRPAEELGLPAQVHGNTPLEIAWTFPPIIILALIAVPTLQVIFSRSSAPVPANADVKVHVIGHQWWWEYRYEGLDIITANEVHMPVGKTTGFFLTSADVIHSFWLPRLGGKRDLQPGHNTEVWWTPYETGLFIGQCGEFCGASHANMRLRAVVETPEEFEAWVRRHQAGNPPPPESAPAAVRRGYQLFTTGACIGCHAIKGTPAQARVGPDLTWFGERRAIAAGMLENTPENLARWLRNPPAVKPGAKMPNLNLPEADVQDLVAYLTSLK